MMFVCTIIFFGTVLINSNIQNTLKMATKKMADFKIITVWPREDKSLKEEINVLLNVNHVIDAYEGGYKEAFVESSFKNKRIDGNITLLRGTSKTLPDIIKGDGFNDENSGVAICPEKFIPISDLALASKKDIINANKIIGDTFFIKYYSYNKEGKKIIKNDEYTKEFKIIGTYDNSKIFNENNSCYISSNDLKEIIEKQRIHEKINNSNITVTNSINVVIDNTNNVNKVIKDIKKLGFEVSEINAKVDMKDINNLNTIIIFTLVITIFIVIIISRFYIKDNNYIKVNKIMSLNLTVYLLGLISSFVILYLVKNNIAELFKFDLIIGGIKIYFLSVIATFLLIVLIPSVITSYFISKKAK